jgi:hypothetical protein
MRIVSSLFALVWNWKCGGRASPAAVLPEIIVVVELHFDVLFPGKGS